jgi:hypothetical protein
VHFSKGILNGLNDLTGKCFGCYNLRLVQNKVLHVTRLRKCVCVCVCVCDNTHTHTQNGNHVSLPGVKRPSRGFLTVPCLTALV